MPPWGADERKRVIFALHCCSVVHNCAGCPYWALTIGKDELCYDRMQLDALRLLQEDAATEDDLK